MDSLLNRARPPVFCPGCSYDRIVHELDRAFCRMDLAGNRIVLVTDIGCSGLLDVFFQTHAMHGLHGRALTYATGLKLARPDLHVVVVMGDGGIGIGAAHFLACCRRNLDLTLLILNNFNYGMTGGQSSSTTPSEAATASGFLNLLDKPLDLCSLADAAGAPFVARASALSVDLAERIEAAIRFSGFAVLDIHGICTGRYTRRNRLTPAVIDEKIAAAPVYGGPLVHNRRREYGTGYRDCAARQKTVSAPLSITPLSAAPLSKATGVLILGRAGQRIQTAGELLALAGIAGGMSASQKNSHDISVLRGASICEVILRPGAIGFTGIERPDVVLALGREGIERKKAVFSRLPPDSLILQAGALDLPVSRAQIRLLDDTTSAVRDQDLALAALALLAGEGRVITVSLLRAAITTRLQGAGRDTALEILARVAEKGSDTLKGVRGND